MFLPSQYDGHDRFCGFFNLFVWFLCALLCILYPVWSLKCRPGWPRNHSKPLASAFFFPEMPILKNTKNLGFTAFWGQDLARSGTPRKGCKSAWNERGRQRKGTLPHSNKPAQAPRGTREQKEEKTGHSFTTPQMGMSPGPCVLPCCQLSVVQQPREIPQQGDCCLDQTLAFRSKFLKVSLCLPLHHTLYPVSSGTIIKVSFGLTAKFISSYFCV